MLVSFVGSPAGLVFEQYGHGLPAMKMFFGETLETRRKRILKTYRRRFREVPFFLPAMTAAEYAEAFELMEAALASGKPVADADIERLTN